LVVTEGKELKWYKINDKWERRISFIFITFVGI
jgi:hypothetical protein